MEFEDNIKIIGKGIYITLIGIVISKFLSYIYRIIIARSGVEIYGTFSLGLALITLLITIALLGLHVGLLRYIPILLAKKEKVESLIYSTIIITLPVSILIGLIIFTQASFISNKLFHTSDLTIVIQILSIIIPLDVIRNLLFNLARAFKKVEYEIYTKNIFEIITKIILTLLLINIGNKVVGISLAYTLSILFSLILLIYFTEKNIIKIKDIFKSKLYPIKELLNYSTPLMLSSLIILTLWNLSSLILGNVRSIVEVGIYNAILPTVQLLYIFPNAILTLFIPVIGELYSKENFDMLKQVSHTVIKYIFLINLLFTSFLMLFSNKILSILFGSTYAIGGLALSILSFGCFIFYLSLPQNNILMIYKKTKTIFIISLIGTIINLILSFLLSKSNGFLGASIAMAITFIFITIITTIISNKISKIKIFDRNYIKIIIGVIISSIIIYFISNLIKLNNFWGLVISGILLAVIYGLFIWITKALTKEDILIVRLVQKKFKINSKLLDKILNRFNN